jgi:hypothetical protein
MRLIAPASRPVAVSTIAKVALLCSFQAGACAPIHAAAAPCGYGCGMLSVVSAISLAPAKRSTSNAS